MSKIQTYMDVVFQSDVIDVWMKEGFGLVSLTTKELCNVKG